MAKYANHQTNKYKKHDFAWKLFLARFVDDWWKLKQHSACISVEQQNEHCSVHRQMGGKEVKHSKRNSCIIYFGWWYSCSNLRQDPFIHRHRHQQIFSTLCPLFPPFTLSFPCGLLVPHSSVAKESFIIWSSTRTPRVTQSVCPYRGGGTLRYVFDTHSASSSLLPFCHSQRNIFQIYFYNFWWKT